MLLKKDPSEWIVMAEWENNWKWIDKYGYIKVLYNTCMKKFKKNVKMQTCLTLRKASPTLPIESLNWWSTIQY